MYLQARCLALFVGDFDFWPIAAHGEDQNEPMTSFAAATARPYGQTIDRFLSDLIIAFHATCGTTQCDTEMYALGTANLNRLRRNFSVRTQEPHVTANG